MFILNKPTIDWNTLFQCIGLLGLEMMDVIFCLLPPVISKSFGTNKAKNDSDCQITIYELDSGINLELKCTSFPASLSLDLDKIYHSQTSVREFDHFKSFYENMASSKLSNTLATTRLLPHFTRPNIEAMKSCRIKELGCVNESQFICTFKKFTIMN